MIADAVNLKPGTLDDTSWLKPSRQLWTKEKQPWLQLAGAELPSFEGQASPRR